MADTEYFCFDSIRFYVKRKFNIDICYGFYLDLIINKEVRFKIIDKDVILINYNDLMDDFDRLYTIYHDIRSNRIKRAYSEMWGKDSHNFYSEEDEIPGENEYLLKYAEYISKLK